MGISAKQNRIQTLLNSVPRGAPFNIHALQSIGVSTALAWKYVKGGWLARLGRGLFMFPNDELQRDPCLKFLAHHMTGLHVGGKTALAWRGVRHNLSAREHLTLWGDGRGTLPGWFTSHFPSRYVGTGLFSEQLPADFGLQPLPESPDGPLVSVPERALLEMLSEVGLRQGVEEARHIMEGMRSVRPEVLEMLLRNCLRVKVARLCVQWAEELNLDWAADARNAAKEKLGKGRWIARLKDGTTLILKP